MEDFEKYYLMAANFLSYRPRSEKEVRDKLLLKKAPNEIVEKVIAEMKRQRFIDDEQFAHDWVRSRSTYRLKSKRVIKIELLQKGIDPEIIERVLNNTTAAPAGGQGDEEEKLDDLAQAKKLAASRIDRYKHLSKYEIYQKLGGFLARRGFNWETSKKAIDDVMNLEYNK